MQKPIGESKMDKTRGIQRVMVCVCVHYKCLLARPRSNAGMEMESVVSKRGKPVDLLAASEKVRRSDGGNMGV